MTEETNAITPIALVTRIEEPSGIDRALFTDWITRVMMDGARYDGFWSGEMSAPSDPDSREWRLVQLFESQEQALVWKDSGARKQLLEHLRTLAVGGTAGVNEELTSGTEPGSGVASAILTDVKAENQEEYFAWEYKIQSAQAQYPGFQGTFFQPPGPNRPGKWTKLVRFNSAKALETWFESERRKALLEEADRFVASRQYQYIFNSFPGWFPIDPKTGKGPPPWKTALIVLLGLYPIIMIQVVLLVPLEHGWPVALRTFTNLLVSVCFTSWISVPYFVKTFSWWLLPAPDAAKTDSLKGALIIVLCLAAQVVLFQWLVK